MGEFLEEGLGGLVNERIFQVKWLGRCELRRTSTDVDCLQGNLYTTPEEGWGGKTYAHQELF